MSTTDHFAIECADGTAITVYIPTRLRAESWRHLREAVDQFPAAVRVLRVQLIGDAWRELPAGLSDLVRHWREVRKQPVHLNLAAHPPRQSMDTIEPDTVVMHG